MNLTDEIIRYYLNWFDSNMSYDAYAVTTGLSRRENELILKCGKDLMELDVPK